MLCIQEFAEVFRPFVKGFLGRVKPRHPGKMGGPDLCRRSPRCTLSSAAAITSPETESTSSNSTITSVTLTARVRAAASSASSTVSNIAYVDTNQSRSQPEHQGSRFLNNRKRV